MGDPSGPPFLYKKDHFQNTKYLIAVNDYKSTNNKKIKKIKTLWQVLGMLAVFPLM